MEPLLDTTEHLTQNITERRLTDAWAELQNHADNGNALQADAYRLAFADPEFLLRRETRGIRFQLEMLKPDLAQQELGIDNTVVVFGSARVARGLDCARAAGGGRGKRRCPLNRPRPRPVAQLGLLRTRPRSSVAPWRATAQAARSQTSSTSAPAAAPASWKRPTAAPTTRARSTWA